MDLINRKYYISVFRYFDKPTYYLVTRLDPADALHQLKRFRRDEGHDLKENQVWPHFNIELLYTEEIPNEKLIDFVRSRALDRVEEPGQMHLGGEYGWYIFDQMPSLEEWQQQYEQYKLSRKELKDTIIQSSPSEQIPLPFE